MARSGASFEIGAAQDVDDIKTKAVESIIKGEDVRLFTRVISPTIEDLLNHILDAILTRYQASDMQMAARLLMKELVTNAAKANFKYLLRQQNKAVISAPEFKKLLLELAMADYEPQLEEADLSITIEFLLLPQSWTLKVRNNCSLDPDEIARLKKKLEVATQGGDVRSLYESNKADAEGAGLGFVFIINALKSAGIDPAAFRLIPDAAGQIEAEIVFPFGGTINTQD